MTTYRKPFFNTWWLESKPYLLFVIREFTSLFVAGYCLFLLLFIAKAGDSQEAYASLILSLKSPTSMVFHLISFTFILYHAITWFNLTPKIMVFHLGEERIPNAFIAGAVYLSWGVVSLIISWLILGS